LTSLKFRGLEIAAKAFNVFNDTSINYAEHPILKGVVYWDKHAQPTSSYCLSDLLQEYYGNLTAATLAFKIAPVSQTGCFHSVAFDYYTMTAYVANPRKTNDTGPQNAYDRQYTYLNLTKLYLVTL